MDTTHAESPEHEKWENISSVAVLLLCLSALAVKHNNSASVPQLLDNGVTTGEMSAKLMLAGNTVIDLSKVTDTEEALIHELSEMSRPAAHVNIQVGDAQGNPVCKISLAATDLAALAKYAAAHPHKLDSQFNTPQSYKNIAEICGVNMKNIQVQYQDKKLSENWLPYTLARGMKHAPEYQSGNYAAIVQEARIEDKDKLIG